MYCSFKNHDIIIQRPIGNFFFHFRTDDVAETTFVILPRLPPAIIGTSILNGNGIFSIHIFDRRGFVIINHLCY